MATPITVVIRNQQYRIVADEDEAYILACAEMVNKALEEALKGTTLSLADGGRHEPGRPLLQGAPGHRQPARPAERGFGRKRPALQRDGGQAQKGKTQRQG